MKNSSKNYIVDNGFQSDFAYSDEQGWRKLLWLPAWKNNSWINLKYQVLLLRRGCN